MSERVDVPGRSESTVDTVAAVWAEVLGAPEVDREAGFFELGADSLTVLHAVGLLRTEWPGLRVVDVFANPSVEALAAYLDRDLPR